jgi:hypothetical protein
MTALSLGYLLGGRWSLHRPSLRKFSRLYFLGAVCLMPLVLFSDSIMNLVFLYLEDPRYGSLITALLLFFLPTVVLGMIAPYSVRLLVRDQHHSGQIAGVLYFVSTLGSALGTLATSFYLVLWFEINTILFGLTATLCLAGLLAYSVKPATDAVEATDAR